MDMNDYQVPEALTILAGIFLAAGAILFITPLVDIIYRRGWRSMMWIMIPVWPINATYLGPLALYLYFRYGRAEKPSRRSNKSSTENQMNNSNGDVENHHGHHMKETEIADLESGNPHHHHVQEPMEGHPSAGHHPMDMNHHMTMDTKPEQGANMHAPDSDVPLWVTVAVGVMHCGSRCVLGDLVGEWLAFGTGATINGQGIWVELLVDYAFALLFGIVFQYFTIGPMSGDYGMKTVIRAIKADFLSLTFFEIGLFGWMVAYSVGIWEYRLMMNTWCYWWMMQVGMLLGAITAFPINWFLITKGIKEPCV